ncbi:E3 ubiquitin-protein ligase [Acrasis kona]|uniref:E3 ubiquitin-protein ligase n=1 Tax=Acrasis kona TaxID=1008807 RepID=A0AAW2ZAA1_9EUKA
MCVLCVTGDHKGHEAISIENYIQQGKREIEQGCKEFIDRHDAALSVACRSELNMRLIGTHHVEYRKQLESVKQTIKSAVDNRFEQLMQESIQEEKRCEELLKCQIENLRNSAQFLKRMGCVLNASKNCAKVIHEITSSIQTTLKHFDSVDLRPVLAPEPIEVDPSIHFCERIAQYRVSNNVRQPVAIKLYHCENYASSCKSLIEIRFQSVTCTNPGPPKCNIAHIELLHDWLTQKILRDQKKPCYQHVWSWGFSNNSRLGFEDKSHRRTPEIVEPLCNKNIVQIVGGCQHSIMLTADGLVYTFGGNRYGQCGHGHNVNVTTPTLVSALSRHRVVLIAGSHSHHSMALLDNGELYGWGCNKFGALGIPATRVNTPTLISFFSNKDVANIYSGGFDDQGFYTFITTRRGDTYCCGKNESGQLGLGDKTDRTIPTLFEGVKDIKMIGAGSYHCLATTNSNKCYSWGSNRYSSLGIAEHIQTNQIMEVETLRGINITSIACGCNFSVALSSCGDVYAWGNHNNGQCGVGTTDYVTILPTLVTGLSHTRVRDIAVACWHVCVITEGGSIYSFGYNGEGRLGLGDDTNRNVPVKIHEANFGPHRIRKIVAGGYHNFALAF